MCSQTVIKSVETKKSMLTVNNNIILFMLKLINLYLRLLSARNCFRH